MGELEIDKNKTMDFADSGAQKVANITRYIEEDEACSACFGSLVHALQRIDEKYGLPKKYDSIYIGQGFQKEAVASLGIGNCTKMAKDNVLGCPPDAKEIVDKLVKYWNLES
ncbi:hypothetical protein [Selenihalanaerobacter shriftii]|uniref:Uncharacterized protein n=1 Tax=Selenihalanaerobacter shriftii TaxID=142842 RepID=A0A1T4JJU6_9FIRM|nr:hypothetical protein [Selenihalanaerobacter shriftii]SJZ30434.1 hypothetical protein SAMN02745118_00062 [Selenihalanaerobacter shriftii]